LSIAKSERALIAREINVLKEIKGAYVVEFIECLQTDDSLIIVLEYCDAGSLQTLIDSKKSLSDDDARKFLKQIAFTFLSLSQGGDAIMHRDIKPDNILLSRIDPESEEYNIKIGDFGFAKTINSLDKNDRKGHTQSIGTPYYMSPQILAQEDYSVKTDVWSTGFTIYEAIFLKFPWKGNTPDQLLNNIKTQKLAFPKKIESDLEDLLTKMLTIKDEQRISWKDVYTHEALKYVEPLIGEENLKL
jgi:serine/threonine protein kinase